MNYKIRLISLNEEFEQLEDTWNTLLSQSPTNNYFLRWEWLWNWWHVFSLDNDELCIIICEKDNEVVAIMPIYTRKRLIGGIYHSRLMMYLGTQEEGDGDVGSDYLDIIYKSGDERGVVSNIFEFIVRNNLCDEISLFRVDVSSDTYLLIQEEAKKYRFLQIVTNEYLSPYINLPSTWEGYLSSITSSMRQKIRKERRRLQKYQEVIFRKTESLDDLERDFQELADIHQERWSARGMKGVFSNDKFTLFHKKIMPYMLKNGHLELCFLLDNNRNMAALYNILYDKKIYFYQSGINVTDTKIALGYIMHSYCIEEAISRGLDEYDFLPDAKLGSYKERFTKEFRKVSDVYMACHWGIKNYVRARELTRNFYRCFKLIYQKNIKVG